MPTYPYYLGTDGYKDRKTHILEKDMEKYPNQPLNVNVQWAYNVDRAAIDIRWDDPAQLATNINFDVLGVNLYRSYDSEYGPYYKLNTVPLAGGFYRDQTINAEVLGEDVSNQFLSLGTEREHRRFIFRTKNYPLVKLASNALAADLPTDVRVFIDGVQARVARVYAATGEVELDSTSVYDTVQNKPVPPVLPREGSVVTCDYSYNLNFISSQDQQRIFYKMTTVGVDRFTSLAQETPLFTCDARHIMQMENLDYIWTEAIHRNKWLLFQSGERVKVFIRKQNGPVCPCFDQELGHAKNSCTICYGVGIRGGYDGPFELIIAPPDAERQVQQTPTGLHTSMIYDTWTGPSPLLSQRDFLVKLNGDRYSIGPVRLPTNRGNVLQQHFNVSLLDQKDIRYKVAVTGTETLTYPQTRTRRWDDDQAETNYPQITEECEIPDPREQRGRTPTHANIVS